MTGFPLTLRQRIPLVGHMPDGDYTQDFLDAGTTLATTEDSAVKLSRPVPVTRAWVEADVLFVEAECCS